jgi:hypothetical protein
MNQTPREDEYTDDVEIVDENENPGSDGGPEPERAAQVNASGSGKGTNFKFIALYVVGLLFVAVLGVSAFMYMRGGNTQNANIKVDKTRQASSSNSKVDSDPTYDEAASIVKPSTSTVTSGTPIPPQNPANMSAPGGGGGILTEPTTGYTLNGGNNDFIYPKPQPSPELNAAKNNSTNGGGGNTRTTRSNKDEPSDEKTVLPRVVSSESETTPITTNAVLRTPSSNSTASTSTYYYASQNSNTQERELTAKFERTNVPVNLPFGTVLPVRLMGAIHSLSPGGYARMELTRAVSNGQYFIPRGTQFIGKLNGDAADRIFIELIGYLDKKGNLVKMSGDVLNTDGSIGVKGKREKLGSKWKRYLAPVAEVARQFGMAYLQRRTDSNVVVIPQDSTLPVLGEANRNRRQNTEFVSVAAGQFAYIFVNNLPPATDGGQGFSDSTDVFSTNDEIRTITNDASNADQLLPRLSPELRRQISANQR